MLQLIRLFAWHEVKAQVKVCETEHKESMLH